MKRRLFALAALAAVLALAAACVPASEEAPPAGAFGFLTQPSPASRHEPFVTSDGWTVRVDLLVLQVGVSANTIGESSRGSYGSAEVYRFDASKSVEMFARAIPAGPASANINLNTSYLGDGTYRYEEQVSSSDLPPEIDARFRVLADASPGQLRAFSGPSMLLVARAEKGDRTIVIDLTFDFYASSRSVTGEVVADALVNVPVVVSAEALFTDEISRTMRFDDYAALDADGDGRLSAREMGAIDRTSLQPRDAGASRPSTRFFDTLRNRAGQLIVAR